MQDIPLGGKIISKDPEDVFKEVTGILLDIEGLFLSKGYEGQFAAFVDYITWGCIQRSVCDTAISDGKINYIQYRNWRIFGLYPLLDEIVMFPGTGIHRHLSIPADE